METRRATENPEPKAAMNPIDESALQELRDMLGDELLEITRLYTMTLPGEAARIVSCFEDADWVQLNRLAHALKGSSANMGATALATVAAAVEKGALSPDPATLQPLVVQLPDLARQTIEALQAKGYAPTAR